MQLTNIFHCKKSVFLIFTTSDVTTRDWRHNVSTYWTIPSKQLTEAKKNSRKDPLNLFENIISATEFHGILHARIPNLVLKWIIELRPFTLILIARITMIIFRQVVRTDGQLIFLFCQKTYDYGQGAQYQIA